MPGHRAVDTPGARVQNERKGNSVRAKNIRRAAVAGMFYPEDARDLHQLVQEYLGAAHLVAPPPKAVIAPHAGYVYSGPVAGSAFLQLQPLKERVRRIVMAGPSHRVPFRGIAVPSTGFFATPLGIVPVDRAAVDGLGDLPGVLTLDAAHAEEHSLEVHLPFLQEVLGEFSIVPLVVGDASTREVAAVLERLWGGPETLFAISSDLSHYHDYDTARAMDRATSQAIEALRPQDIKPEHACGRLPILGLLEMARSHGLKGRTLDLRNSGDTAGPRDEVVGYGAYAFA